MSNLLKLAMLLAVAFTLNCHAALMLVNDPCLSVWVNREEHQGPYEYPLVPHGRAVGLYTQICYGEIVAKQEVGNGLVAVQVPGQLRFSLSEQGVGAIPGFSQAAGLIKNDDLLELQPLVVTADAATVHKRPCPRTRGSEIIRVPFGSILRAADQPDHEDWRAVHLHDGRIGYVQQVDIAVYGERMPSPELLRESILYHAQRFVGMPYNLGGRSLFKKGENRVLSSVDCSALVFLAYHACGLFIPKTAHPQFLFSTECDPVDMQPGDLVFFKRKSKNFALVGHVAMYLGNGQLIESTGLKNSEQRVRIVSVENYFGAPLEDLYQGCEVMQADKEAHATLFFRTFLPSDAAALGLRRKFLSLMRGDFTSLLDAP